jgi:hypothetical protein
MDLTLGKYYDGHASKELDLTIEDVKGLRRNIEHFLDVPGNKNYYYVYVGREEARLSPYLHQDGMWRASTLSGPNKSTGLFETEEGARAAIDLAIKFLEE